MNKFVLEKSKPFRTWKFSQEWKISCQIVTFNPFLADVGLRLPENKTLFSGVMKWEHDQIWSSKVCPPDNLLLSVNVFYFFGLCSFSIV